MVIPGLNGCTQIVFLFNTQLQVITIRRRVSTSITLGRYRYDNIIYHVHINVSIRKPAVCVAELLSVTLWQRTFCAYAFEKSLFNTISFICSNNRHRIAHSINNEIFMYFFITNVSHANRRHVITYVWKQWNARGSIVSWSAVVWRKSLLCPTSLTINTAFTVQSVHSFIDQYHNNI